MTTKTETAEETFALPESRLAEIPPTPADPGPMRAVFHWNPRDLQLMKQGVARGTTDAEFLEFVARCKLLQLNPIKREVYCIIFNADKPAKRQVVHVIAIGGYRTVAQRNGDYRGIRSSAPPVAKFSEEAKDPDVNPLGLVSVEVTVWRQTGPGELFDHWGIARWSELAPMYWDQAKGKRCLKDGFWKTMPELMLEKCAEAAAIRRAWPSDFNGTYGDEEMERGRSDQDVLEAIAQIEQDDALAKAQISATTYQLTFGSPVLVPVEAGDLVDTAAAHLRTLDADEARFWKVANRESLRQFFVKNKADGLEIHRLIEKKVSEGGPAAAQTTPKDEDPEPGPVGAADQDPSQRAPEGLGEPMPDGDEEPAAQALWLKQAILAATSRHAAEKLWSKHGLDLRDDVRGEVENAFAKHWEGLRG